MPDISEKRIRKSFPGVKERREGGRERERGRRLLGTGNSGDSVTQRKVVDRSCRKGNMWKKGRVGVKVSVRRGMCSWQVWVYTCVSTPKCMYIFIYAAEKAHVYTKVYINPHWIVKTPSCAPPKKIITLT